MTIGWPLKSANKQPDTAVVIKVSGMPINPLVLSPTIEIMGLFYMFVSFT